MGTGGAKKLRYMLDTSVFLESWHRVAPRDVAPGFWERFEVLIKDGEAKAPDEVLVELEKKDDEVLAWIRARKEVLFLPIGIHEQQMVRQVLRSYPRLVDTRKERSMCDPWVIAYAKVYDCTVVSAEGRTHDLRTPKIPDVCDAMGIRCIDIWGLVRAERWTLIAG